MRARPVLLIDPDAEWCAQICRFLEPQGIPVVSSEYVGAALDTMAEVGKPRALVLDSATRGANSRAMTALRSDAAYKDIPVGYLNKSAALDVLLLMVSSSAPLPRHRAA